MDEALSPTLPKLNNFKVKIGRKTSKVEAVDVSTGTDPSQLFTAGLTDAEGVATTAPNHNSITSEAEFRALVNVYAGSISQSAVFEIVPAFDNTFDNGVQATVGAESFTWNVSNHGADAAAGTGPHATRDGVGLSFTDAELSAIRTTTGTVSLTLKDAAEATDVVTLDYKTKNKDQTKDVIEDLAGNDLQSIKGFEVNNITADALTGLSTKQGSGFNAAGPLGESSFQLSNINNTFDLVSASDMSDSSLLDESLYGDQLGLFLPLEEFLA